MPEATDILLPLTVAERIAQAMETTEEHAAAAEGAAVRVERRLDTLEARVAPALDAFKAELDARASERASTNAARLEGRSAFERLFTGKPAFAIYGAIVLAIAGILTQRGCTMPTAPAAAPTHLEATPDGQ